MASPVLANLTPAERRFAARKEWERRVAEGGIRYFEPANAGQEAFLRFTKQGAIVKGGNRAGKTVVGAAEAVYRLTGTHPYKRTHRPPIKLWACSQDLPGRTKPKPDGSQEVHKQLEQLRRWIPKEALRGQSWEKAFSPGEMTLGLANGSLVVFKGYDQGPLKFESDAVHAIWLDEEPDDPNIWTSCLTRLADFKGQWWLTFTPVLSLYGKGWVQRLWEARNEANCQYECFELFPKQNKHLSADTLEQIYANLTDEERKVREEGAFAMLGGRVLSELTPDHYFDPWDLWNAPIPPAGFRHWCILDPGGVNATAALFASADDWGNVYAWGEHYERDQLPEVHMASIHAMWLVYCQYWGYAPPITVLADPNLWNIERTIARGKLGMSAGDEYDRVAAQIGADWWKPRPADQADHFAWRLKRYLKHYRLWISHECKMWRWEAERWRRVLAPNGIRAQEIPEPEMPVQKDNHLMDCTRYLLNELPEPVPQPEQPEPESWEKLVREFQEQAGKRIVRPGEMGTEW